MIDSPRVCVQVQSVYIESQSTPDEERFVFAYTVTIRNLGRMPVQLLGRYWLITNGNGREIEVQGEGVVGEQPHIAPGEEYQFAGAIRGESIKVITEEVTGLPIPADSEIVLAGWCHPNKYRPEGPYGEWTGYYGRQTQSPTIEVERIYYRNDPIIVGSPDSRPPSDAAYGQILFRSALLHEILTKNGIPGIKAVWLSKEVNGPPLAIISLKQMYSGHAKQAAVLACQLRMLDLQGRYVVVVDDDIDPTNIAEVLWAMCSRVNPEEDIDIIRGTPSTTLDARVPRDAKTKDSLSFVNSRAIINACKPYEWIDEFPISIDIEPEIIDRVRAKWKDLVE